MTPHHCLNCEKELSGNFCSGCGQKADTHRISFKHFLLHDVLHGTFHIDRGILYTTRQALVRPGAAALDYIAGKRKRYYNVFYLILMTIGLMLFFRHVDELFNGHPTAVVPESSDLNEASKELNAIFAQKSKFIILLFVPFAALNSFLLFRRKRLNLSEHAIVSGMILLGILLLSTLANMYFHFNNALHLNSTIASLVITAILFGYVGFGYWNAFHHDYSGIGMAYRIVLFFALIFLETLILIYLLIGVVTNWQFGVVTLAPFS